MEFRLIIEQILSEDGMMSGGAGSVYGAGVVSTETPFSGDTYANQDARNVLGGAFPGMLTRNGMTGKRKYSYKKAGKKASKKKSKKKSKK
jgi:hypothetical protein